MSVDNFNIVPTTPEAASFERFGKLEVNASSGVPNIRVPLHTIRLKDFDWNVGLSYHARGFKVDDIAGSVGLGWNISLNGMISATVLGRSDVIRPLDDVESVLKRDLELGGSYSSTGQIEYNNYDDKRLADEALDPMGKNYMPDIFTLNIGELNHKFFLKPVDDSIPADDTTTVRYTSVGYTMPASNTVIRLTSMVDRYNEQLKEAVFEVTDPKGNRYFLSAKGANSVINRCGTQRLAYSDPSYVFYLDSIRTFREEWVKFHYQDVTYTYRYDKTPSEVRAERIYNDSQCSELNIESYNGGCPTIRFIAEEPLLAAVEASDRTVLSVNYRLRADLPISYGADGTPIETAVSGFAVFKDSQHRRTFDFEQGHFDAGPDADDKRLRLDAVKELDADQQDPKRYVFHYNPEMLPNRLSLSQDSAGYFNGKSNTTLIPRFSDRRSSLSGTQACVLEKISYPTGGSSVFRYALSGLPDKGLVVSEIEDFDGRETTQKRSFSYREPRGGGPEGWVTVEDAYFTTSTGRFISCLVQKEHSHPYDENVLSRIDRPDPYFGKVEEVFGADGEGGKIVYLFTWERVAGRTAAFLPVKLREKQTYARAAGAPGGFVPVQREVFHHGARVAEIGSRYEEPSGIKEKKVFGKEIVMVHDETFANGAGYPAQYLQRPFDLRSVPFYQTAHETWQYSPDGTNEIYTSKEYHFDNDWHGMPTRTEAPTSDGGWLETVTNYPGDYKEGEEGEAVAGLLSRNRVEEPVETVTIYHGAGNASEGRVIEAKATVFTEEGLPGRLYELGNLEGRAEVPLQAFRYSNSATDGSHPYTEGLTPEEDRRTAFNPDLRNYELKAEFVYGRFGTANEIRVTDRASYAYLWDDERQHPIASAANAIQNQVAFTSFEDDRGGWDYVPAVSTESHTGRQCFSGQELRSGTLPSGVYFVQLWTKGSNAVKVNGQDPLTSLPANAQGWVMAEWKLTDPGVITVSNPVGNLIDEVRLFPEGAHMTSYTYHPLYGVSSSTDANGVTTYFEYDGHGRLKAVLDQSHHVIRSYEYHYAGPGQ